MQLDMLAAADTMAAPPLYEQYRPRCFGDVLGQAKALAKLEQIAGKRGIGGKAYWLSGPSGTGKTTIARLIAGTLADPINVVEMDSSDLDMRTLRDIERASHLAGWGEKHGRAYIINEAHGLRSRPDVIRKLETLLEAIPRHVVWCFTTTVAGQQSLFEGAEAAGPLLSRCVALPMAQRGLADLFAARAKEIAQAEGLDGQPVAKYKRLVQLCRNNMRGVLQAIEAGEMLA